MSQSLVEELRFLGAVTLLEAHGVRWWVCWPAHQFSPASVAKKDRDQTEVKIRDNYR